MEDLKWVIFKNKLEIKSKLTGKQKISGKMKKSDQSFKTLISIYFLPFTIT